MGHNMSWLVSALAGLPKEFVTILIAAIPVGEVRVSVPLAIAAFHLHPMMAFFASWIGNLLPIFFVFVFFPPILKWAEAHWPRLHQTAERYFSGLRAKHSASIDKYGALALAIFVAIPSPGTGTWSAAVLATLFGIKPSYGIPAMMIGSAVATLVMLLATEGFFGVFRFLS